MRLKKNILLYLFILIALPQKGNAVPIIVYDGDLDYVQAAVKRANEVLNNPDFYLELRKIKEFGNTSLSGSEIADLIQTATQKINIKTYWYWNPFHPRSCVNANTKTSTEISINKRCFSEELVEAVTTLIHETVHAVDWLDGKQNFTHRTNKRQGNEDTAPYVIEEIGKKLAVSNRLEKSPIKTVLGFANNENENSIQMCLKSGMSICGKTQLKTILIKEFA